MFRLASFSRLLELQARMRRWPMHRFSNNPAPLRDVVSPIQFAARLVPGSTCLQRCLVEQLILSWSGHEAEIRYGVASTSKGQLSAHAWLLVNGVTEIGRGIPGVFTDLEV
jgi:hypothetical protein